MKRFLLLCVALLLISEVSAKPPGGGGFRSSSSSSSFRSSSGSGWGTRSTPSASKSGWGTKSTPSVKASTPAAKSSWSTDRPATKPVATSSVDSAAYKKAKESGKAFQTPQAAAADFKAKSASKYTNNYKTEPTSRPSHIPPATTVGGKTVNVTYNAGLGGYGYMHPTLGTWMLYDMMSDAVMVNSMMRRDGYYVGPAPSGFAAAVGWCVLTTVLLVFIAVVVSFAK